MSRPSPSEGERRFAISELLDVFTARRAARLYAVGLGFSSIVAQELAIVVSELGTNIVKYGVRGAITLRPIDHAARGAGLEIVAEDEGPPLRDLETAIKDGHGDDGPIDPARQLRRGGIGAGLGAVVRFSDEFHYEPGAPRKRFRATRYLHRPKRTRET